MVATRQRAITLAELEELDPDGKIYELIDGQLVEAEPVGLEHGHLAMGLGGYVWMFNLQHNLGAVFNADTRFTLDPSGPTVVKPDAAFVSAARLPAHSAWGASAPFAPDLAIEVVSPGDAEAAVLAKVAYYLKAGTRLVWLVRPRAHTVTVFSIDQPEKILTIADELDGGDVLPGFRLRLADLFRLPSGVTE